MQSRKLIDQGLILALVAVALQGCAAAVSQPKPVISASSTVDYVNRNYALASVYSRYNAQQDPARRNFRNDFILNYMNAIDARYYEFRGKLSAEHKGIGLGSDVVLLALAGAGSVATSAASEIAVATTGIVGLRGAIDRNLYADKSLDALVASMDAERFRVAAAITEKMARDSENYPLAAAIGDLRAYQLAGTLEDAVLNVSQEAAAQRKEAKQAYDRAVRYACVPSQELANESLPIGNLNRKIMREAMTERDTGQGDVTKLNKLKTLADIYGVPTTTSIEEMSLGIVSAFNAGFCTVDELKAFNAKLTATFPQ